MGLRKRAFYPEMLLDRLLRQFDFPGICHFQVKTAKVRVSPATVLQGDREWGQIGGECLGFRRKPGLRLRQPSDQRDVGREGDSFKLPCQFFDPCLQETGLWFGWHKPQGKIL